MAQITAPGMADGETIAASAGPVIVAVQCVRLGLAYRLSIRRRRNLGQYRRCMATTPTGIAIKAKTTPARSANFRMPVLLSVVSDRQHA